MKSPSIPPEWEYWTTEPGTQEAAWALAVKLKQRREALRPDLFTRVRVVRAGKAWWILRREEPRVKETTP